MSILDLFFSNDRLKRIEKSNTLQESNNKLREAPKEQNTFMLTSSLLSLKRFSKISRQVRSVARYFSEYY